MDTIAHGLWTYALSRRLHTQVAWRTLVFFGMLPDLIWLPFTGFDVLAHHTLVYHLLPYDISHSLIIWLAVSLVMMIRWRHAFLLTWPWALHILVDIPGHIALPTPFLWPISHFAIRGWWDWLTIPWFIANYVVLTATFAVMWLAHRRRV